jgi:hypothetical protein
VIVRHFNWRTEVNWGDLLGPLLLERFAGVQTAWEPFETAELVTVGSVLQLMPRDWPGIVAGAGMLKRSSPFRYGPHTEILALRGPRTARGVPGDYALGDPGLLADELLSQLPLKEHLLGILPHWHDRELEHRPEFLRYKPLIIHANEPPLDVIRKIGSCRKLVTSSLHGVIVADAFGIPRRIEEMSLTRMDTNFKFADYCASVRMRFVTGVTASPKWQRVEDRKHEVFDMFRELGSRYR